MPAEPPGLAAFEGAAEPATALVFSASKTLLASALGPRGLNLIE
jgi:hypothetical protein